MCTCTHVIIFQYMYSLELRQGNLSHQNNCGLELSKNCYHLNVFQRTPGTWARTAWNTNWSAPVNVIVTHRVSGLSDGYSPCTVRTSWLLDTLGLHHLEYIHHTLRSMVVKAQRIQNASLWSHSAWWVPITQTTHSMCHNYIHRSRSVCVSGYVRAQVPGVLWNTFKW